MEVSKMKAHKLLEIVKIDATQVGYFMSKGYTITDDEGNYLPCPEEYAEELLKKQEAQNQSAEIPLGDLEQIPSIIQELKQAKADIEYMSMVSGINLEEG